MRHGLRIIALCLLVGSGSVKAQFAFPLGGAEPFANDVVHDVAADSEGNLYVIGDFVGEADFDPDPDAAFILTTSGTLTFESFLASYTPTGAFRWAFRLADGRAYFSSGVAVTAGGSVLATGSFDGIADFDPDPGSEAPLSALDAGHKVFVAQYTSEGAYEWAIAFGGAQADPKVAGLNRGVDVTTALDGDVLVCGSFRGTTDFDPDPTGTALYTADRGEAIYVARYSSSGTYRWAVALDNESTFMGTGGAGSVVADDESVVVTGLFFGVTDFDPDTSSSALLDGRFGEAFVASYDGEGRYQWAFDVSTEGQGQAVALDGSGNTYVTGYFRDTADFDPDSASTAILTATQPGRATYLASYDPEGAYRWAFALQSSNGSEVILDQEQNVLYLTGKFGSTVDFDPSDTGEALLQGAGDVYLASYTTDAVYRWAIGLNGPNDVAQGLGLALLPPGRIAVVGEFRDTVDFHPAREDSLLLTTAGWQDGFVAAYTDGGGFPVAVEGFPLGTSTQRLTATPNPFGRQTTVRVAVPSVQRVRVALYDVLGREVAVLHDGEAAAGTLRLALASHDLAPGTYVVRAVGETFRTAQTVTRLR